jgi:pilus assembly protein CpaC
MYTETADSNAVRPRGRTALRATIVALTSALLLGLPAGALETATFETPATPEPTGPEINRLVPTSGDKVVDLSGASRDAVNLLEMEYGRSVTVRAPSRVKRVAVGNAEALDVVVFGSREVQLVPKAMGSTNVVFWGDNRVIGAIDVEIGAPHSALQRVLRKTLGHDDIHVEGAAESIVIKGTVPDLVTQEHALTMARAYVGKEQEGRIVNLLSVGGHQQVMLKVVIAEMSRQMTREFGTNFAGVVSGSRGDVAFASWLGGLTGFVDGTAVAEGIEVSDAVNLALTLTGFGDLEFLAVLLDALDQKGMSKVLAEPTLIARSGETASFLVGGEVPIPVAQGGAFGSITVEFKDFGIGLGFTPTVLTDNRIHLSVNPEVSAPDFSFASEIAQGTTIPSFRTRRASTGVELADGQTLAIAGLLSEEVTQLVDQFPLLGQIPILGTLFRSSQFQKNETELVILVTPRLVKPLGEGPHPLPTDGFVEPNMFEVWMLGKLEGRPRKSSGGMVGDVGHRVSDSPYWSEK